MSPPRVLTSFVPTASPVALQSATKAARCCCPVKSSPLSPPSSSFLSTPFLTHSPYRTCSPKPSPTYPIACLPGTGIYAPDLDKSSVRIVVFGATGYIGRFVVGEFARQGYHVVAFVRERSGVGGKDDAEAVRRSFGDDVTVVCGDVTDCASVATAFDGGADFASTVVVSCLASRTGGIGDSNRIDYEATLNTLKEGRAAGAGHFILLSAICVQKPLLEFQRAKLRFERELVKEAEGAADGFSYSIVRPTAFFKSLAAQVPRQKKGRSYIMFGDGALSKCNALSEADLARFMALCAREESKRNAILPVGGPGEPVTPKEQADIVFAAAGQKAKYTSVPIGIMDAAISFLDGLSKLIPVDGLRDAAEFGRIGKYYATEDMVGPPFGEDTLESFFTAAVSEGGMKGQDLGDAKYF